MLAITAIAKKKATLLSIFNKFTQQSQSSHNINSITSRLPSEKILHKLQRSKQLSLVKNCLIMTTFEIKNMENSVGKNKELYENFKRRQGKSYKRNDYLYSESRKSWYHIIFDIQWKIMSTEEKVEKKPKKQLTKEEQKANSNNWKEIQAQKKKAKQQKVKEGGIVDKDKDKDKKEQKKQKKKSKGKEQQPAITQQKQEEKPRGESAPDKVYRKLSTIHDAICLKNPKLIQNRSHQVMLIGKKIEGILSDSSVILHLGTGKFTKPYQFVEIPNLTNHPQSDLICRYQDISCLLEDSIDKVVCEAEVIFGNGSVLLKKGYSNIIYVAELYKVPIVVSCGSWNYSGCVPHNEEELERLYGPDILENYDWISQNSINLVSMELGAIHPSQITEHITQGYKSYGFKSISW